MQIKVKLVYQIFVTKPRRIQWRTEEAYLKSEAVAALPKLRRGLGGADFEDCFLKDAGHDRVYCFRLAPKVSLPSGSENDRDGLIRFQNSQPPCQVSTIHHEHTCTSLFPLTSLIKTLVIGVT